jgi:rhodanese-related sulfurtransferase
MTIKNVDAATLKTWLQNDEVVLIDVREPFEYEAANISQAILMPLATISNQVLPQLNGKKLVIHCRSGKRSLDACNLLLVENEDLEVYNLEGGILAWLDLQK